MAQHDDDESNGAAPAPGNADPKAIAAEAASDRRAFLKSAGIMAAAVPPAMTFLLSTTLASPAIAKSGKASGSDHEDDDDHDDDDDNHDNEDEDDGDDRRGRGRDRHY